MMAYQLIVGCRKRKQLLQIRSERGYFGKSVLFKSFSRWKIKSDYTINMALWRVIPEAVARIGSNGFFSSLHDHVPRLDPH